MTLFIHFRQVAPDMTVPCFIGYRNPQRSIAKRQCATSRLSSQHMWPRRGSGVRFTCNAASSTKLDFSFFYREPEILPSKIRLELAYTSHVQFPTSFFHSSKFHSHSASQCCVRRTPLASSSSSSSMSAVSDRISLNRRGWLLCLSHCCRDRCCWYHRRCSQSACTRRGVCHKNLFPSINTLRFPRL